MFRELGFATGLAAVVYLVLTVPSTVRAEEQSQQAKLEQLQKELNEIKRELNEPAPTLRSNVDRALDSKYGPNATAVAKTGKLTIGVLTQVWYQDFQQDHRGLFNDSAVNSVFDTNEGRDNSSFRIRRTEIRFTMDLTENVRSVVMIDPAREAISFPQVTDNQVNSPTPFARQNQVAPEFDAVNGPGLGSSNSISNIQTGAGAVPRLLQDAFISFHGVIPHHDFQSGQFKPFFGEEGLRSNAQLDFVERSFVGIIQENRDLGEVAHGTWWDDRFQYWGGVYDSAGNYYLSSGNQPQNRSDDNDFKDYAVRALIRPVWSECALGKMELGASAQMGKHGESGGPDPIANPINGLNRRKTWAQKYDIWGYYAPGSILKGLWLRGEWLSLYDRNAPRTVIDVQGNGNADDGLGGGGSLRQTNGKPFGSQGFYAAVGYRLPNDCGPGPAWLRQLEFAGRFDTFQNVQVANLVRNDHTDVFYTRVWTAGVNYYLTGNNTKIQANYNIVENPASRDPNRVFHDVRNNSFVVNFQVAF